MSAEPSDTPAGPVNKHLPTPVEKQRMQLNKLLKDPAKPVAIPAAPKEKTLRPPREMMKNVQGSSAGAGSGEFHVYKQNRRREYERLKLMDEKTKKEADEREFEQRKREREEQAEAKTAKNRAKRQKKKENKKAGPKDKEAGEGSGHAAASGDGSSPLKKKRLVADGKEVVFRRPGDESDGDENMEEANVDDVQQTEETGLTDEAQAAVPVIDEPKIIIHDD